MTRLARPLHRRTPETIVALVDVVFFLLVFAMMIGRMDATAPFAVSPPIATSGTDMPGGGVTITISARSETALDGLVVDSDALARGIADRLALNPDTRVRINADAALELRHVLPLVEDLSRLGAREVILVVTPGG